MNQLSRKASKQKPNMLKQHGHSRVQKPTLILKAHSVVAQNITNLNVRSVLILPRISQFAQNILD